MHYMTAAIVFHRKLSVKTIFDYFCSNVGIFYSNYNRDENFLEENDAFFDYVHVLHSFCHNCRNKKLNKIINNELNCLNANCLILKKKLNSFM